MTRSASAAQSIWVGPAPVWDLRARWWPMRQRVDHPDHLVLYQWRGVLWIPEHQSNRSAYEMERAHLCCIMAYWRMPSTVGSCSRVICWTHWWRARAPRLKGVGSFDKGMWETTCPNDCSVLSLVCSFMKKGLVSPWRVPSHCAALLPSPLIGATMPPLCQSISRRVNIVHETN